MELYQIRYFLALCETLNFARAAERCGICAPSLTRTVQKLEQEFGGVLIRRERRFTHLTELGRLVRPMFEEVLSEAERTKSAAQQLLNGKGAPLKLGVMASIGPLRVAPFLARFGMKHENIELAIIEGDAAQLRELLLGGPLEVAVAVHASTAGERLRQHRLYRERLVAVFPPGHRFERLDAVRLIDLKEENFLLRARCEMVLLLQDCREQGFEPKVVYRSEREDWLQMMIAAGRGVTIMPEYTHFARGTLARPLIEPALARDVSLLTVAGRPHPPRVHMLVRAMRAHWAEEARTSSGLMSTR